MKIELKIQSYILEMNDIILRFLFPFKCTSAVNQLKGLKSPADNF